MDSESFSSPIPWGLVEHVHRTKTGKTVMAISLPIETRARMAQAALDLGCSKLALVRASINQFLMAHEETRRSGQERAFAAVSEPLPPVADPEPVAATVPTVAGMEPESEPIMVPEPTPIMVPESEPTVEKNIPSPRKRSKSKS